MTAMMIESPYTMPRPPIYRLVMKLLLADGHPHHILGASGKEICTINSGMITAVSSRPDAREELLKLADKFSEIGYWFVELTRNG